MVRMCPSHLVETSQGFGQGFTHLHRASYGMQGPLLEEHRYNYGQAAVSVSSLLCRCMTSGCGRSNTLASQVIAPSEQMHSTTSLQA